MGKGPFRGKVLVVDDSSVSLELLVAQLEATGFGVAAVDSGFAALDAAKHETFDAVVLDVQMPGMDGMAVGRALRDDPQTAALAIAMYTDLPESDVRFGFPDYDLFLPKPCETQFLGNSLHRLLTKARS